MSRGPLLLALLAVLPPADRVAGGGGGGMFGDVNISSILDSFSVSYDKRVRPNYGGLHSRLLLQTVLDGPATRVQEAARSRDSLGRLRVHQEHLGARHLLREREAILLPHRHDQQRVHPHSPLGLHHTQHQVDHHGVVSHESTVLPDGPTALPHRNRELYTMRDILYAWKDGAFSVGMSSQVQLPQFRVLGHRRRSSVVALSRRRGQGGRLHDAGHPVQVERGPQLRGSLARGLPPAVQGARPPSARHGDLPHDRELLAARVRDPVRAIDGLLPDPDLHPVGSDRDHLVGVVLVEPERDAGARAARRHHRAHDDYAHVLHQRGAAQDLVREVDRRVSRHLLRDGVHQPARVRDRRLHVQEDTDEEAEVRRYTEDHGREERPARASSVGLALALQDEHYEPVSGGEVLGGALQGAGSEGALEGRHAGEHVEPRRLQRGSAAHHAPAAPGQGPRQVPGHDSVGHRQVLAHHVPGVLRVLQPHVLDRVPARVRRGRRRPRTAQRQVSRSSVRAAPRPTYVPRDS